MRTKLTCDTANQIAVMDMMMGVNNNIDDIEDLKAQDAQIDVDILALGSAITDNSTRITVLEANVPGNPGDIADLELRVTGLEADLPIIEASATMANDGVATNAMAIGVLEPEVMSNTTRLNAIDLTIADSQMMMQTTFGMATSNTNEIELLKLRVEDLEKGTVSSLLMHHQVAGGTGGGSAVDMTWTARPLGTDLVNDIGATVGPTSVTLLPGKYSIRAIAVAEGANQSRLNFGAGMLYGTTLSASGASEMQGTVELIAATNISVETIVETTSGMDTLGKASPFTEDSVFLTLEVIKVGV